jgi:hypothetical protein
VCACRDRKKHISANKTMNNYNDISESTSGGGSIICVALLCTSWRQQRRHQRQQHFWSVVIAAKLCALWRWQRLIDVGHFAYICMVSCCRCLRLYLSVCGFVFSFCICVYGVRPFQPQEATWAQKPNPAGGSVAMPRELQGAQFCVRPVRRDKSGQSFRGTGDGMHSI